MARTTYQSEGNFQAPFTSVQGSQVPSGAFGGLSEGLNDLARGMQGLGSGLLQAGELAQRHKDEEIQMARTALDQRLSLIVGNARAAGEIAHEQLLSGEKAPTMTPDDTDSYLVTELPETESQTYSRLLKEGLGSDALFLDARKRLENSGEAEYVAARVSLMAQQPGLDLYLKERDRMHDSARDAELSSISTNLAQCSTAERVSAVVGHWKSNVCLRKSDAPRLENAEQGAVYQQLVYLRSQGQPVTDEQVTQLQGRGALSPMHAAGLLDDIHRKGPVSLEPLAELTKRTLANNDIAPELSAAAETALHQVGAYGTDDQKRQAEGYHQAIKLSSALRSLTSGAIPVDDKGLPTTTVVQIVGQLDQQHDDGRVAELARLCGLPFNQIDSHEQSAIKSQISQAIIDARNCINDGSWVTHDVALMASAQGVLDGRFSDSSVKAYKALVSVRAKAWGADPNQTPKVPAPVLQSTAALFNGQNPDIDRFLEIDRAISPQFPDFYPSMARVLAANKSPYAAAVDMAGHLSVARANPTKGSQDPVKVFLTAAKTALSAQAELPTGISSSSTEVRQLLGTITDAGTVRLNNMLEQGRFTSNPSEFRTPAYWLAAHDAMAVRMGMPDSHGACIDLLLRMGINQGSSINPTDLADPRVLRAGMQKVAALLFDGVSVVSLTGEEASPTTMQTGLSLVPNAYLQKPTMFGARDSSVATAEGPGEHTTAMQTVAQSLFDFQDGATYGTLPGERLSGEGLLRSWLHGLPAIASGLPALQVLGSWETAKEWAGGRQIGTSYAALRRNYGLATSLPLGTQGVRSLGNAVAIKLGGEVTDHNQWVFESEVQQASASSDRHLIEELSPNVLSAIRNLEKSGMNQSGYVASVMRQNGLLVPAPDGSGDMEVRVASASGSNLIGSSTGTPMYSTQAVHRWDRTKGAYVPVVIPASVWQAMVSKSNYDNSIQGWMGNRAPVVFAGVKRALSGLSSIDVAPLHQ